METLGQIITQYVGIQLWYSHLFSVRIYCLLQCYSEFV
jgi:hypothetical protein